MHAVPVIVVGDLKYQQYYEREVAFDHLGRVLPSPILYIAGKLS